MDAQNRRESLNPRSYRPSLSVSIIGSIVLLLTVFGLIVSSLGYVNFTNAYKEGYATSTYRIANTASALVNGDHLDDYLNGYEFEEYLQTKEYLDIFCQKMDVSMIYVIVVDTSDYWLFTSVFNPINNSADYTEYTEWELGHKRNTTNEEYRQKYRALYEQGSPYETVYRLNPADGHQPHITTMVPVKDSAGEVSGILCIQRPISHLNRARLPYMRSVALSTLLLALVSSVFAAVLTRKRLIQPILKVSEEATRFARENTKGPGLDVISPYQEISSLAGSIDKMETDMVSYVENLTTATAEKERTRTELHMAARIQEGMLPVSFPAFPDRPEFDIYAVMNPARQVGGDFYDFFLVDSDHLCLMIADVSGKGIPAALFMMSSMITLKNNAMRGSSPAEILKSTNAAIYSNNPMEMFVTVWLGILEISTGKLTAANAGHENPALMHKGGRFEIVKDQHGFVIGAMEDMSYKDYELTLEPGAKLFVYTDGVPEAADVNQNLFGTDRMVDALNAAADGTPEQVLTSDRAAINDYVKDAEQFDDLTMLCLEYKGKDVTKDED